VQRRTDLQSFLNEYEQTLLTTTDLGLFDANFVEQGTVWQVEQGLVRVPAQR
jgi:DNA replication and repair protein RecF